MAAPPEVLEQLDVFRGVDRRTLHALATAAETRDVAQAALLFEEGGIPGHLFLVQSGLVELHAGARGRRATILLLWPGDLVMPAAALTGEPWLLSASTLGPARLLAMEAERARSLFRASLSLSNRVSEIIGGQFRALVRGMKDLRLRPAPCRVGAFLLRLLDEAAESGFADLPAKKSVIASRLGLTAESFSRALARLAAEGVVVRGSRVVLTDRERLARFCGADPLFDSRETRLAVSAI